MDDAISCFSNVLCIWDWGYNVADPHFLGNRKRCKSFIAVAYVRQEIGFFIDFACY